MKKIRTVLLMSDELGAFAIRVANDEGVALDAIIVSDLAGLQSACLRTPELLLSFGSGIIVPQRILASAGMLAINIHAASPDYPGRDPHHFASYDGAEQYGATMHYMTARVDDGPIIDTELFDVVPEATPAHLLSLANEAGVTLMRRLFFRLGAGEALFPLENVQWGKRKSTRKMFLEMCRLDCNASLEEFNRRLRATSMPGYNNLFIEIHGKKFRLESSE